MQDWFPSAPPLPKPTGRLIHFSSARELFRAAKEVRPGGTILLADGQYMMPRYLELCTDNVTRRSKPGQRERVVTDGARSRHAELIGVYVFVGIRDRTGSARGAILVWVDSRDCTIERNIVIDCDTGICLGNLHRGKNTKIHCTRCVVRTTSSAARPRRACALPKLGCAIQDKLRLNGRLIGRRVKGLSWRRLAASEPGSES